MSDSPADCGRRAQVAGAVLMALATLIGALAAHALKSRLPPERFDVLQTAVLYQFLHALGLLFIGAQAARTAALGLCLASGLLFAGVLLFSGSLYLILMGAPRMVGVLTPLGGLCLIAGWSVAALSLWRAAQRDAA